MALGQIQGRPVTPFTFTVDTYSGAVNTYTTFVEGVAPTGTFDADETVQIADVGGALFDVTTLSGSIDSIVLVEGNGSTGYQNSDILTLDISSLTGISAGTYVSTVSSVVGDTATVTPTGGTGFLDGDIITADELASTTGSGTGMAGVVTTAVAGVVTVFTVTEFGVSYEAGIDTGIYDGSGEIGIPDDRYSDHNQYELGGNVDEYTDSTQSSYKPSIPPNVLGDDQILVNTVMKADQPQWIVQQRDIDGGTVTVFAEPNIVDKNGNRVGMTARAEDCVDQYRCEANGFVWVADGSTGDASQGVYGYCREVTPADVDGTATSQADCPTGFKFDIDNCNTAWTATEINDGTALAAEGVYDEDTGVGFIASKSCAASGNHWESSESNPDERCLDGTTAGTFSFAAFVDTVTGVNYNTTSTSQSYAETTCKQFGFYWDKDNQECVVYTDPVTLTTKETCTAEGHVWIAGVCYDGAEFGDGQNRTGTVQQDPTAVPK